MKIINDNCYKGTRILIGNNRSLKVERIKEILRREQFTELYMPIIYPRELFADKVGEENNNMMFGVLERGGRDLVLAPEYTSIVSGLGSSRFKDYKDLKLFYVSECFRGEKPQKGRFRQFTQIGVEVLNPVKTKQEDLVYLALHLIKELVDIKDYNLKNILDVNVGVKRGLDYYKDGYGFEVTCNLLGSAKQICGGGTYKNGIGFAIGLDRTLLMEGLDLPNKRLDELIENNKSKK